MKTTWTRYLLAAALILLAGAVWALAEEIEMKVEVRNEGGQEIMVDVNGVTETVRLDDLADGEERSFDVGGHPITIKRIDDQLTVVHEDGPAAMIHELDGDGAANMVWVTEDEASNDGVHKIVIVKSGDELADASGNVMFLGDGGPGDHQVLVFKGEDGELDIEALKEKYGDDFEEFETTEGHRVLKWVGEGDAGQAFVVRTGDAQFFSDDFAVFRCEETGSMLTVKDDGHLLDTYLDPVTGCVMKKMDSPAKKVIRVEVIAEDDADD